MNPFAYREYRNNLKLSDFGIINPLLGNERGIEKIGGIPPENEKMAKNEQKEVKKPVRKYRIGTIQLAVWENKGKDDNTFCTYTISASYYDENTKSYKDSSSVSRQQLQNLHAIIGKAIADEVFYEQNY